MLLHFGELLQVLPDDGRQLSQRKLGKETMAVSRLSPLSSIQTR